MAIRAGALAFLIAATSAANALGEIDTGRISESVVRIKITGKWSGSGREVSKVGTGFFIPAAGFVMTAGHVFDPKETETDGDVQWENPPQVELEYMQAGSKVTLQATESSLLYIDEQLDLALIGTTLRREGLPLGSGLHLQEDQPIKIVAFGSGTDNVRQNPDFVSGSVESPASFNRKYRGMVDIRASGLFESDSGSPVLDEDGQPIGIFVKGRKYSAIGEVAVPIAFAAPLLSMAGIAYPPPAIKDLLSESDSKRIKEFEAAIRELKAEIVGYRIEFPKSISGRDLHVTYTKRLATGFDPSPIPLRVRLLKGQQVFETNDLVAHVKPRPENAKPTKIRSGDGSGLQRAFGDFPAKSCNCREARLQLPSTAEDRDHSFRQVQPPGQPDHPR